MNSVQHQTHTRTRELPGAASGALAGCVAGQPAHLPLSGRTPLGSHNTAAIYGGGLAAGTTNELTIPYITYALTCMRMCMCIATAPSFSTVFTNARHTRTASLLHTYAVIYYMSMCTVYVYTVP